MNSNDREKFARACERAAQTERGRSGGSSKKPRSIGTLSEKTLHAALKWYYEPDGSRHEVAVGGYIADIAGESGIIEIQTRNFAKLRPKLKELLELTRVTVVYPIVADKRILSVESDTGEFISSRKSPRHRGLYSSTRELYAIKSLLAHPNLTVRMPVVAADERRIFGVRTRRRKKQHTSRGEYVSDIIPTELLDEHVFESPQDYAVFLPHSLPDKFTADDFASAASIDVRTARQLVNVLRTLGLIDKVGADGRKNLYAVCGK